MTWLDGLFRQGGSSSIALTDENKNLTEEEARPRILKLTGTLTANRTIKVPGIPGGDWVIWNATTGGYSLVVAGLQGAATVTVGANARKRIEYEPSLGVFESGAADFSNPGVIGDNTPNTGYFMTVHVMPQGGVGGVVYDGSCNDSYVIFSTKTASATAHAGGTLQLFGQPATASTTTPGAVAGGNIVLRAGAAARLTSGDAVGGDVRIEPGRNIGSSAHGVFVVQPDSLSTVDGDLMHVKSYGGTLRFRIHQNVTMVRGLHIGFADDYVRILREQTRNAGYSLVDDGASLTGVDVIPQHGGVETSDATVTTMITVPIGTDISADSQGTLRFSGTARLASGDVKSFELVVAWKVVLGTLTIGTPADLLGALGTLGAGAGACAVTFSTSGTSILVRVTGIAATNISWGGISRLFFNYYY